MRLLLKSHYDAGSLQGSLHIHYLNPDRIQKNRYATIIVIIIIKIIELGDF